MLRRNAFIFIGISVLAALSVLALTSTRQTLAALTHIKPLYLVIAFAFWATYLGLEGLRMKVLLNAFAPRATWWRGFELVVIGVFMAVVTPFGAGGLPVQIYIMSKDKVPAGATTGAVMMRGALIFVFALFVLPLILFFEAGMLEHTLVRLLVRYLVILYGLLAAVGAAFLFLPRLTQGIVTWVTGFFVRWSRVRAARVVARELGRFRATLRGYFRGGRAKLLWALLLTPLSSLAFLAIAPVLLLGLGVPADIPRTILVQLALIFILNFAPTPGASGLAEAGGAALFALVCPRYLVGVYTLLWRFFATYLMAALGGLLLVNFFRVREIEGALRRRTPSDS